MTVKTTSNMVKVELNKKESNPFYGLRNCLTLFQGKQINDTILNDAFSEVKDDSEKKKMFYSLLFSFGDIVNREHNIFHHSKVDNGGSSMREEFHKIMLWMRKYQYPQFVKFLNEGLFNEYTCFDNLFRNRVITKKNTRVVKGTYDMLSNSLYRTDLAKYIATIINGNNPFNKMLVAKFLTLPRLGRRAKHSKMQETTKQIMLDKCKFLVELSEMVGWDYVFTGSYANFIGI